MNLYPHQHTGVDFLSRRGFACLWDSMGTGKSAQAIVAAGKVNARRILVFCPSAVKLQWADEAERWQSLDRPITVIDGYPKAPPSHGWTILSHATLANEQACQTLVRGSPYDVIILDESHVGFRNDSAKRARNFYLGIAQPRYATHVWCLTGTPVVNSAADLYLMAKGMLGEGFAYYDWCQHFTGIKRDPFSPQGYRPLGVKNADKLANYLREHVLRRTLDSVGVVLPPLTETDVTVTVPLSVRDEINSELSHWTEKKIALAMREGRELADPALATLRRFIGLAKAPVIADFARKIPTPFVVFFQHTAVRDILATKLHAEGRTVSWIDGTITRGQLKAAKDWFAQGKIDVLLVQTDAGGVGLNLQRASTCIIAELPWTAVALQQAAARIHRIGQTKPCTAYVMRLADCWLEDLLARTISAKAQGADDLLGRLTTNV